MPHPLKFPTQDHENSEVNCPELNRTTPRHRDCKLKLSVVIHCFNLSRVQTLGYTQLVVFKTSGAPI